ncbi:MAG: patatin-like phospholipase family protein [Dehalococcoidales bacterium]|jgi:NTE family protein
MGLKTGKKIGLALGSGSARGLAHVGVLKVLERAGVTPSFITGTSAGALIGALYARGQSAAQIEDLILEQIDWKKMPRLFDLTLPRTGFIAGRRLINLIKQIIGGDVDFADLDIPFACVATDIDTGYEVVLNRGSVAEAIRASISIPVIFSVANHQGRRLVDGSLTTAVPVSLARELGADYVIAVNVLPEKLEALPGSVSKVAAHRAVHNIFNVILQSIYITIHQQIEVCLAGADCVIKPDVGYIGSGDFLRARELFLEGEAAAMAALPEIKHWLAGS